MTQTHAWLGAGLIATALTVAPVAAQQGGAATSGSLKGPDRAFLAEATKGNRGEVALADAVIALTSNIAMREKRRIEFQEAWFDPKSPEVPDGKTTSAVART